MNPLRDRSTETGRQQVSPRDARRPLRRTAQKWEHDYHKKYAKYICQSEQQHPLLSWELADWEERPPLIILHYRGKRPSNAGPGQSGIDQDLFTLTVENQGGEWVVTKYDAMY